MGRRIYEVHTSDPDPGGVPELRRSRQPVPKWMRVAAIVVGTAIGGAVGSTTSGAVIASRLGLETKGAHDEEREADKREQKARDAVIDGEFVDIKMRFDKSDKSQAAMAQAIQSISRAMKKLRPAPKDLP